METIHDRMAVILYQSEFDDRLHPDNHDPKYLHNFLQPYPDDAMKKHIVAKEVGNVNNNEEGLRKKAAFFY